MPSFKNRFLLWQPFAWATKHWAQFFVYWAVRSPFVNLGLVITLSPLVAYQSVPGGKRRILRRDLGLESHPQHNCKRQISPNKENTAQAEAVNDLSFSNPKRVGERERQLIKISFSGRNVNVQAILWFMLIAKGHGSKKNPLLDQQEDYGVITFYTQTQKRGKIKERKKSKSKSCSQNDHE